ncbi:MAG: hypothetical protein NUV46_00705, partial [Nanoarchaeota archaeon]|nr:hypothetical protein [Nanoarchaeota archaeon]
MINKSTNKSIIGKQGTRNTELGDINELIKLADSYKEPIKIKEPKKKNIETKVNPVVPISGDLSFVTDENLYKEIIKYMDKEFPNSK